MIAPANPKKGRRPLFEPAPCARSIGDSTSALGQKPTTVTLVNLVRFVAASRHPFANQIANQLCGTAQHQALQMKMV
jgi:hypothetical protein